MTINRTINRSGMTALRLMTSVSMLALVSGCVTTQEREAAVSPQVAHSYLADKPEELHPHFYVTLAQGNRNKVLNEMRLGLATFEMGRFDLSEELFEDALQRIEAIYADNEQATKARQVFIKELVKDFKGEPYERVMAYFYRGLLYMHNGEYDTARASFLNGMLQDQLADEEQYQADFALMAYMQGWASRCAANPSLAKMDYEEFHKLEPSTPLPAESDNVMILAETGRAPRKYSATDPKATKPRYLKFNNGSFSLGANAARVSYPSYLTVPAPKGSKAGPTVQRTDNTIRLTQIEDIFYQASTRGGRAFDSILAGKAQFKNVTNTVGNVALVGAGAAAGYALQRNDRDAAIAAGIMLLIAAGAKAAAEAAEPNADTRYWDNLPQIVHATTITLPETVGTVKVDFLRGDAVITTKEVEIWRAGKCGFGWVREETAQPSTPRAPFSAPEDQMYQAVVIPPLPPEPAVVVAGQSGTQETGGGTPVQANATPTNATDDDDALGKLKSGFMNLFAPRSAAAAEAEAKSSDKPADKEEQQ